MIERDQAQRLRELVRDTAQHDTSAAHKATVVVISEASERYLNMATPLAGWIPPIEPESPSSDASISELVQFLLERKQTALAALTRQATA